MSPTDNNETHMLESSGHGELESIQRSQGYYGRKKFPYIVHI